MVTASLPHFIENIIIYGENISLVFIICAVITFLAVWIAWKIETKSDFSEEPLSRTPSTHADGISQNRSSMQTSSNMDHKKWKTLLQSIENNLSPDDKLREAEIEIQQLVDILALMENDQQFNTMTMDDLQEQLQLYM